MCGVAGIVNRDGRPVERATVERMTDAIAHRGPDGEGQYVDGAVGLGNRRLAVIDLSPAGAQPMQNERGDVTITYNGEIYNFRELRAELESAGRRFRSRSDTEVVLQAYEEWGPAFVERLNGMFAFAIWDAGARTLLLARDRYGVKPLYTTQIGDTFLFASEIKSFLVHPEFGVACSARVLHVPEHLLGRDALPRRHASSTRPYVDGAVERVGARASPLLGLRLRREEQRRLGR